MLENVLHQPRAGLRWRGPVAVLSLLAHGAALAGVIVVGMWRIDKLEPTDSPVTFVGSVGVSLPDEGGPKPKTPTPTAKHKVDTPRQPTEKREEAAATSGEQTTVGTNDGQPTTTDSILACPPGADCTPSILQNIQDPVCGNGKVEGAEQCDDGGVAAGDGCSASCRTETRSVGQRDIEAQRIAGDPQIAPPDSVRTQMARAREAQVVGNVKMCLDKQGEVTSLRIVRSTGYSEYDARLTERMRSWRYRPFQVNGTAVPVCSTVTFIYRMQ